MKYEDTPECPMCGRWVCDECGTQKSGLNRYFPGQHKCNKCKSVKGHMIPTHHRSVYKKRDHDQTAEDFEAAGYERKY